ncbi:hypothetical protein [Paenibacillus plantarum]|nr:hypothetical protein [Paenibacillus plantarum]
MKDIKRCPKCESVEGYFIKQTVSGKINYRFNFDGSEADNGDMHDHLEYKGGSVAYCLKCKKRLFRMDTK